MEEEYRAWQREQTGPLTNSERTEVLKLAKDFHRVWQLANSTERKRIVRLIIKDVALEKMNDSEWIALRITWQTGCVSEHRVRRRVRSYSIALRRHPAGCMKGARLQRAPRRTR